VVVTGVTDVAALASLEEAAAALLLEKVRGGGTTTLVLEKADCEAIASEEAGIDGLACDDESSEDASAIANIHVSPDVEDSYRVSSLPIRLALNSLPISPLSLY
jgi:hypothetical protein